jgi:hypothetical protein
MPDPVRRVAALLCLACWMGGAPIADAADGPREMHGSADIFSAPGVALAWGVLRGASEAATEVVIRIEADPAMFASLAVVGGDPFTKGERPILPLTSTAARVDVRVPRAHFADFPRTELRLFASARPSPGDPPALVVFYLGVPDTAPEFPSATALDAYLGPRIAQARQGAGNKRP